MSSDVFDIDSILAEFSSYSSDLSGQKASSGEPAEFSPVQQDDPYQQSAYYGEPQQHEYYEEPRQSGYHEEPRQQEYYEEPRQQEYFEQPRQGKKSSRKAARTERPDEWEEEEEFDEPSRSGKRPSFLSRRRDPQAEAIEEDSDDEFPGFGEVRPEKLRIGFMRHVLAVIFAAATVLCLYWLVNNIHPDIGISETMHTDAKMDLVSKIDVFANNSKSDALGDLAYIRKIYTIDRSAPCGPKPIPDAFSTYSINDAGQVMELVEKARASGLLEGQDVIFSPDLDFYHDSDIQCYYDDTLLVICWKEVIDRRVCSCVEVKIADASQFRRKLTADSFGSSVTQYTTQMAASVNAVTAMNADFYAFRPYGIVVYQGEIYRYNTSLDTLFIDDKGDFRFMHRYEDPGQEAVQQFVNENHIQFSLSFGPVLVEDGVVQHLTDNYGGVGEMNMEYSRAAIGQFDTLHYLYMAVSHSYDGTPRATVNQFADIIATKNLRQAFNLDGGQTGEVVFNGTPYNHIDFGNERLMSDCIYFCTAIPESEVSR